MATVRGDRAINNILKGLPNVKGAVDAAALEIGVKAEAKLNRHRQSGASRIEVESGRVDSYVWLVDPDDAMAIEFGHWHVPPNSKGPVDLGEIKWVDGLYIVSEAAGLL
ncbi:DUF5403 family protein [Amycolatopsis sp.]|uniref:DUF5403 family protein n=1 Tax=Amycolatopsis sp. TaxID=37632 RepID=UPI002C4CEA4F|nr:DUF5403 family protein [Amycolatopsis sp.]HVV11579.1 DUF5403 family protein [Amycolatopsis sp.]